MLGRDEARDGWWKETLDRWRATAATAWRWLPALALALALSACGPSEPVTPVASPSLPPSVPAAASPQSVPAAKVPQAPQPTAAPAAAKPAGATTAPPRPTAPVPAPQVSPVASPQRAPAATPVPPPTPVPALTARVTAPRVAIAPGASTTVTLEASLASGSLGAWTVDLTYNPSVATLSACEPSGVSVCNPNLAPDTVRIVGVALEGVTGSQTLASLTFQAVGAAGASSPLTITVVDLVDPDGGPIGAAPTHGSISVGGAS